MFIINWKLAVCFFEEGAVWLIWSHLSWVNFEIYLCH